MTHYGKYGELHWFLSRCPANHAAQNTGPLTGGICAKIFTIKVDFLQEFFWKKVTCPEKVAQAVWQVDRKL